MYTWFRFFLYRNTSHNTALGRLKGCQVLVSERERHENRYLTSLNSQVIWSMGIMHITCALFFVYTRNNIVDTALCKDLYMETLSRVYYFTSISWTVRSRKVESFRTEMRLLGPTQPMLVPSPLLPQPSRKNWSSSGG